MIGKPPLLLLMALAASVAAVANAVSAASPADQPQTRLGVAINQDLYARDKTATRRDRSLDMREQAARATEERIKAELEARDKANSAAAGGKGSIPEDQFTNLARIYSAMKPSAAAAVFEQLDMEVQMKVAERMRERATALILASMTPKGAAALSMAMARRHPAAPRPAG